MITGGFLGPTPPPDEGGGWLDWLDPGEWIEAAGQGILEQIAQGVGEAAAALLSGIWGVISESTTPQVDAEFMQTWVGRVFAISLPITVGFMALQVILTVIRARGPAGLARAVWGGAAAVLGTFAAIPIVALLVTAMDTLAMNLADLTSGDIETLVAQVTHLLLGDDPENVPQIIGGGPLGTVGAIIFGFLTVLGAVAVWVALLIRAMLLYVVLVITPICLCGLAWEPTRGWFRKWLTLVVALVFTKLGVVLVFGLGVAAVSSAGLGDSTWEQLGQMFSGLVMLLMAALVPLATFKFFSFLGEESVQALHAGAAGGAARGVDAARSTVSRPMDALRRRASSGGESGGESGGGSGGGRPGQQQPSSGQQPAGAEVAGKHAKTGGGTPAAAGASANGSGAAGGAGKGAAGGAAGALVGAGMAAGAKTAEDGRAGSAHADAHREQAESGTGGASPAQSPGPRRGSDSNGRQGSGNGERSGSGGSPAPAQGGGPTPSTSSAPARGSSPRSSSGGGGVKAPPVGKP